MHLLSWHKRPFLILSSNRTVCFPSPLVKARLWVFGESRRWKPRPRQVDSLEEQLRPWLIQAPQCRAVLGHHGDLESRGGSSPMGGVRGTHWPGVLGQWRRGQREVAPILVDALRDAPASARGRLLRTWGCGNTGLKCEWGRPAQHPCRLGVCLTRGHGSRSHGPSHAPPSSPVWLLCE